MAEFESQPALDPGQDGWWKVWGASPQDIRAGDLVFTRGEADGDVDSFFVQETFTSKAAPMRVGIVVDGRQQSIGALAPIVLVRRGTKNTLAGSVR